MKAPAIFIGHGTPMNALLDNEFTKTLRSFGEDLKKPKAILCISAHWLTQGTFVLEEKQPRMIYDMYGFPKELYEVDYPAPGSPEFAAITKSLSPAQDIQFDNEWGFDHGTWSILKWMYPKADIPVYQLSIDYRKPMKYHYELAREIARIREKGVMVMGSGNITHNLRIVDREVNASPLEWAQEFDFLTKEAISNREDDKITNYQLLGKESELAIPEPSHWIPLIYTLGMSDTKEPVQHFYEEIQHGSISMRCVKIG